MNLTLTCAAVVLTLGTLIWRSVLRARLRVQNLQTIPPAMGFSMVPLGTRLGIDTPLFHRGDRKKNHLSSAMEGKVAGMRTILFDFYYEIEVQSGSDVDGCTKTIGCTVAAFEVPERDLPSFSITRKGVATWFEQDKIKIEEDQLFSERFVVSGTDQTAVRALLGPAICQYLATTQLPEKIVIEGAGPWLILYPRNKNLPPERWKSFSDETSAIARAFVQYCTPVQSVQGRFGG